MRKFAARLIGTSLGLATALMICAGNVVPVAADSIEAALQAREMRRGINVLGYDPIWQDPAKARFQQRHIAEIKAAGFATLRINLQAFAHMNADGKLEPQWLSTLDAIVKGATTQGMIVIIDEHDFHPCFLDAASCRTKLAAFWRQIAPRYRDAPNTLLFELLNEPGGQFDAEWNDDLARLLGIVRESNPARNVIIGPASGNSFGALDRLKLPENDRHIIVTVHYYDPIAFTHQGASWVKNGQMPTGVTWGTKLERQRLDMNFDAVARWSRAHDRPIFLGEFGAYDKADLASRTTYDAAVARAAEARGWPWAYWQFDSDFIVYDMKRQQWVMPILKALVP